MLPLHFWDIINRGRFEQTDEDNCVSIITRVMAKESPQRIIEFCKVKDELFVKLYQYTRYKTGLIYKLELSDDGFVDFLSWVMLQGQEFYHQVLNDEIEFNIDNIGSDGDFSCFSSLVHEEYWINQGLDVDTIWELDDERSYDSWYNQYTK